MRQIRSWFPLRRVDLAAVCFASGLLAGMTYLALVLWWNKP